MDSNERKHSTINLLRKRQSIVSGLQPGDRVTAKWDKTRLQWLLVIESENGLTIRHERLTEEAETA